MLARLITLTPTLIILVIVNNKMLEYDWFLTAYIYNGSRT